MKKLDYMNDFELGEMISSLEIQKSKKSKELIKIILLTSFAKIW